MSLDSPEDPDTTRVAATPKASSGESPEAWQDAFTAEPEFTPGPRFWLALAPILILALMVSLDGTSVSVALPVSRWILLARLLCRLLTLAFTRFWQMISAVLPFRPFGLVPVFY